MIDIMLDSLSNRPFGPSMVIKPIPTVGFASSPALIKSQTTIETVPHGLSITCSTEAAMK
ncbi:hypothetical protein Pmar_PMAR027429 [Perkinsus marinus ATCC 50983]|uniref:Uncharacterized protein n=1 Tax=Perkinsus marinus (strain ATCC 50983 / TXsc) TaxID=423536 RepID=C5KLS3_PERM5|nr:hypothetical protein Pmar_PMAR027429 [Perkinsus marinus ATCC 50983]EER14567.1 hypothetical protein Pmar_PMAR027429 [Perkinsus marinus ATCC 50983]|eukprot:XP_002782772.1 hypothetical protein Pmar_PMAR027429 [Perkinsus marinus ATCC 50983]